MKILKQVTANNIGLSPYKFRKELAMEAYLIENEEILSLDNENFSEVSVLDAEIALKKGRRDKDGRIDILASYGTEFLSIIELKLDQVDDNSLEQLENYLDQKEQILEFGEYWKGEIEPQWVGVLVGSSIAPNLQEKLACGYRYKETIPIAGVVLNRFRSEDGNIFVVSDTYFSYKYSDKDFSKFAYQNQTYNKGRLVNQVLKDYIENNPSTSFAQLRELFPKQIQGSYGVFDKLTIAEEIYSQTGRKRHYLKPTETINLIDGEIIATSTQWGVSNIQDFIQNARKLGYKIEKV